jgi:nitroreductase
MRFSEARELITSRRTVLPKRLVAPGPTVAQVDELLALAAAAPDHGQITPWRFLLVPTDQRSRLAQAFALALRDRDESATEEQIESAREKAHRAPLLIIAIARLAADGSDIPPLERMVSLGAAVQNILLGAHAMGYGAGLTSGQAMSSIRIRTLCELAEGEQAICCINIGSVSQRRLGDRTRPVPGQILATLS